MSANTTEFLAWAVGGGANVETSADYESESRLPLGYQSGLVPGPVLNKTLRQGTVVAAMITQFIADTLGVNVADDGNVAGLETLWEEALTVYASAPAPASLVHGGVDTGTANALNVAVMPVITGIRANMYLIVFPKYAATSGATAQNPATITINNTGTSAITSPLFRNDGTPIQKGDYGTGPTEFVSDGSGNWYLSSTPAFQTRIHVGDDLSTTANTMIVTSNPPLAAYAKYNTLVTCPAVTNTEAVVVNQDNLGPRNVVRQDGEPLQQFDLLAERPIILEDDGTQYCLVGLAQSQVPVIPPGNAATLYFGSNGSDTTGTGTQASPFATPQVAVNYGISRYSLSGGKLTLQMTTPGNYPVPTIPPGVGTIIISGIPGNTTNCILSGNAQTSGSLQLKNVTVVSTIANACSILSQSGGALEIDSSCNIIIENGAYGLQTGPGGSIVVNGIGSVSGNGIAAFLAQSGTIEFGAANVAFTGTPSYSAAMLLADSLATVYFIANASFSGPISGVGAHADHNAIIRTANVSLPGSTPTFANGGQVVP